MTSDQEGADTGSSPQDFGPVQSLLNHHGQDRQSGWQESAEAAGGHVAKPREGQAIPRTSLAERYRQQLSKAQSEVAEGR